MSNAHGQAATSRSSSRPVPADARERALIREAIRSGERNPNRLTDRVFFSRYPQRKGTRLTSSDPMLSRLRREWLDIRDRLVRPAVLSAPTRRPTARGSFVWARRLLPLLERHRDDIPLAFILGWIEAESGGQIHIVTKSLNERGYFQIHPDESKMLKLDHNRLSRDPDYSVASGIALIRNRTRRAKQLGFTYGKEPFWEVVKLLHWLPLGVEVIVAMMRREGVWPATWTELKGYIARRRTPIMRGIAAKHPKGLTWDPLRGVANVDKVLQRGQLILQAIRSP